MIIFTYNLKQIIMETFVITSWSMYYHIYKYLNVTGDLSGALKRWDQRRVKYFWNWILENSGNNKVN